MRSIFQMHKIKLHFTASYFFCARVCNGKKNLGEKTEQGLPKNLFYSMLSELKLQVLINSVCPQMRLTSL